MLSINLDDVMQVLTNVRSYLIAFGVVLALAIIVMVAVRKLPKAKKKMIRFRQRHHQRGDLCKGNSAGQ